MSGLPLTQLINQEAKAHDRALRQIDSSGRFKRFDDYLAEAPKTLPYVVDGLLYQQAAHQLMGTIKAGKTLFMLLLIKAVLRGETFIGQRTAACSVLYVTEQPRFTFQQQLRDAGFDGLVKAIHGLPENPLLEQQSASFYVIDLQDLGMLDWPARAALIRDAVKKIRAKLVVIDTFIRIALIEEVASAGEANSAFERIVPVVTEDGCALVLNWHERKAGGTIVEAAQGTVAHGGAVDMLLRLQRVPSERFSSRARQLETIGRIQTAFEEPVVIEANQSKTEYRALGRVARFKRRAVGDLVLRLLPEGEPGLTLSELLEKLEADCAERQEETPSKGTVENTLADLLEERSIRQSGKGYKADRHDPFRYRRVSVDGF